jgi:hypothetical protein
MQMDVGELPIHSQKCEFWQVYGTRLLHKLLCSHVAVIEELEDEDVMFLSLQLEGISTEEYPSHLQLVHAPPHHPIHLELSLLN